MKKVAALLLILFSIQLIPNKAFADGVAVVDLDGVAKELKVLEFIQVTLSNKRAELGQSLGETQQKLQSEFNQIVKSAGDEISEEEKRKLLTVNKEKQLQFRKKEAEVNREFQILRLKLINDFRTELKPIALQVAKQKGCKVVLNKVMPPVYVWDESADITKDVTAAAKAAGLTRTVPEKKTN